MTAQDDGVRVYLRHVRLVPHPGSRARGLCMKGVREWFNTNNLDFRRFTSDGMTAAELRAPGCVLCERVIAVAREEAERGE